MTPALVITNSCEIEIGYIGQDGGPCGKMAHAECSVCKRHVCDGHLYICCDGLYGSCCISEHMSSKAENAHR